MELGCGPGVGIGRVATLASEGFVAGIDFSETMVAMAQKRNAAAVAAGRVELRAGEVSSMPYGDRTFDKVFAVQLIFFCRPPDGFLREARRVLKSGGRLAVSFITMENAAKWPFAKPDIFTLCTGPDAKKLIVDAGFTDVRVMTKHFASAGMGICAIGER